MAFETSKNNYVLIGAGIMSATLGTFLKLLNPKAKITIVERLEGLALESTDASNNAGTGHAGMLEMNYTPERPDGSIDCTKAFKINEQFEISKQFWSWMVSNGMMPNNFIHPVPHMAIVFGEKEMNFLEKRVSIQKSHPMFHTMKYSADHDQIKEWIPLIMQGRPASDKLSVSRMEEGADVNFGALARNLLNYMKGCEGVEIITGCEASDVKRKGNGWVVTTKDVKSGSVNKLDADFVFIGAGGRALELLQKSGIPESKGYAGFPVSGLFLGCNNKTIINQHHAKVYGKAAKGAPPMSVPHLDTRQFETGQELLFGPFAGFSTKFLKHGSYWDLPRSIRLHNLYPMIKVGLDNFSLVKYLVSQVSLKPKDRVETLRQFYPEAKLEDWDLMIAGQRVQVIKKDPQKGGILAFGTEVISSADGSIAALLGASPGASTSVYIILNVLKTCFKDMLSNTEIIKRMQEMIPSFGHSLVDEKEMVLPIRKKSHEILGLTYNE